MQHPIPRYCRRVGITQRDFSIRVGISPQSVTEWIAGRCWPGRDVALRIVQQTGGEITLSDLFTWQPSSEDAA